MFQVANRKRDELNRRLNRITVFNCLEIFEIDNYHLSVTVFSNQNKVHVSDRSEVDDHCSISAQLYDTSDSGFKQRCDHQPVTGYVPRVMCSAALSEISAKLLIYDTAEDEGDKNLYLFEPVRQGIRLCKKTSNTIGATRHVKA